MVTAPRHPTEDRRGSPRSRLSAAIVLQHPAPLRPERLTAEIVDLSPLGLSLDVQGTPVAGAGLLLELPATGEGPQQLAARIVRVESLADNRHRVGCELLTELSRRDYTALRNRFAATLPRR